MKSIAAYSFRDIVGHFVKLFLSNNRNAIDPRFDEFVAYCYIDTDAGMTFQIMGGLKDGKVYKKPGHSIKLRYDDGLLLELYNYPDDDMRREAESIENIFTPKWIGRVRDNRLYDTYRDRRFPDDMIITVSTMLSDGRFDETLWVRPVCLTKNNNLIARTIEPGRAIDNGTAMIIMQIRTGNCEITGMTIEVLEFVNYIIASGRENVDGFSRAKIQLDLNELRAYESGNLESGYDADEDEDEYESDDDDNAEDVEDEDLDLEYVSVDTKKKLDFLFSACDKIEELGAKPYGINSSLRDIFRADVISFLMYLSSSDGHIVPAERDYINELFETNFTTKDIVNMVNDYDIYSVEYEDKMPPSFRFIAEWEAKMHQRRGSKPEDDQTLVDLLIDFYRDAGIEFVSCDGGVDKQEVEDMSLYLAKKKLILQRIKESVDPDDIGYIGGKKG